MVKSELSPTVENYEVSVYTIFKSGWNIIAHKTKPLPIINTDSIYNAT